MLAMPGIIPLPVAVMWSPSHMCVQGDLGPYVAAFHFGLGKPSPCTYLQQKIVLQARNNEGMSTPL
jgi:hypothetical protein